MADQVVECYAVDAVGFEASAFARSADHFGSVSASIKPCDKSTPSHESASLPLGEVEAG